jgi:ferric enterobactin receptor
MRLRRDDSGQRWRSLLLAAGLAVTVLGSVGLAVAVRGRGGLPIDLTISRAVQGVHGEWFEAPLRVMSAIGFFPLVDVMDAVVLLLIFVVGWRWEATAALLDALGGAGLNHLAKALVERPRPTTDLLHVDHVIHNSSFPAGHVLNFTAFAGFLCYLAYVRLAPSKRRTALIAFLVFLILIMGLARIDAGEHWPSDVLGGYLIAGAWLIVVVGFYRWGARRLGPRRPAVRIVVSFAALGMIQSAPADSASVSGSFVDARVKTPLAAVEVVVRTSTDSTVVAHTTTGADGRFRLDGLRLERYQLRASLLGYQPWVRRDLNLTERGPDLDLGTIALAVSPIAIKGVDVKTARATAIVAPDRNIYLTKDMPSATTGTATDVLRSVPELDVDIDGHVSLRGSNSVNIQFNGRATPLKREDLATFLRQMPASRIERVEVIANPSAKFDPEGMAGIVNLVLKDNVGLGLSGNVNLTAGARYSSPGARVAWQKGKFTLFGGASGSLYYYKYESFTARQNLFTPGSSSFTWDVDNKYKGRYGLFDTSVDYALSKRTTLYGTVNGSHGLSDPHTVTRSVLSDSTGVETNRYDRTDDGSSSNHTTTFTLGVQNVVRQGRDERSIEFMQSGTTGDNHTYGLQHTLVPAGTDDQVSKLLGASGYLERRLQVDDTHPLGAQGKIELGYRGSERLSTNSSRLRFFEDGAPVVTPRTADSDYRHREVFHSGYITLGSTFGHLSLQGGVRAEFAHTTFDVRSRGEEFDHHYRSVFPSANMAWDFGKGRNARLTYSRRIERPSANYLNPDVPAPDSLNRFVGNPDLAPKYTNSYSLDASWTGSHGTLRFSPYLRETVDNWDIVTHVDTAGIATSTYLNASSVTVYGVSLTASMRQVGRLGGTMSIGISHEHHDASNLSSQFMGDVRDWSANGNLTFKTTSKLDLQGYLRYAPARRLAQGRASSYTGSQLSARWKLSEKASASLAITDPFNLSNYSNSTSDATYVQSSTTHNRLRSISGSFTWAWGKPPEEKQRRQTAEQPQPDASGAPR